MNVRYLFVDGDGRLTLVMKRLIEALWQGRLCAARGAAGRCDSVSSACCATAGCCPKKSSCCACR